MDNHAFRAVNEVARRVPRTIPRLNRFASKVASQRERVGGRTRSSRPRGSCASRRWSTRCRANTPSRRCAPPRRSWSATRSVPDRAAVRGRRRHVPLSRLRRRCRLRRRPRVQGDGVRGPFREVETGWRRSTAARPWGKRSYLSAAELAPALPTLGRLPGDPARAGPGRPLRQRVVAPRAGMSVPSGNPSERVAEMTRCELSTSTTRCRSTTRTTPRATAAGSSTSKEAIGDAGAFHLPLDPQPAGGRVLPGQRQGRRSDRRSRHARDGAARREPRLLRRRDLEEGLPLAAVGRHCVDDLAARTSSTS